MNKVLFVIVGIVVVLGLGFYANNQSKVNQEKIAMKAKEDLAMKQKKEAETIAMKKNDEAMAMTINDTSSKKGTLSDVSGGTGSGTAYILRKDKLYHTIVAKLPDPESGSFYEGWMVLKTSNGPVFFSTGKLSKAKDGNYDLVFSSDNLYEGYNFVVVTLEKVDDKKPEKHILEGTVK